MTAGKQGQGEGGEWEGFHAHRLTRPASPPRGKIIAEKLPADEIAQKLAKHGRGEEA